LGAFFMINDVRMNLIKNTKATVTFKKIGLRGSGIWLN